MPRFDEFSYLSAGYLARRLCDREQEKEKDDWDGLNFCNFCSYPALANSNATAPKKKKIVSNCPFFSVFMYII